ncbi:MAG: peptidoglycan DD-metalloendopeptidase family protein [Bacilli bacterium]|nr:peptidoglycan DD-metalloendopeptidase family protein [Bacilli bacterium]
MSKKNNNFPIVGVIISLVVAFVITFLGTNDVFGEQKIPMESYRVYLKGESIGLIKSESELYDYINKMQQSLKEKYNVDNVYIPNDINVVKDVTYEENLTTISNIYNIINEKSPFTIKGYMVTIDKTNTTNYVDDAQVESDEKDDSNEPKILFLNILDKEMFENAVKKTILSFVTEEEYENFINETQKSIVTTGEIIEDLYVEDVVTIKEAYLPVNEKIYTSEEELTAHLLFGSEQNMSSYRVKKGDTLNEVAEANKMNVNEILIANSNLRTSNALLYEGQELTIGVLDPVFTTVEEKHVVADQTIAYKTEYVYDNTKLVGYQAVQTQGSNGITRITQKIKSVNGEIVTALISSQEEIKPVVNEVIVKGGRKPVIATAGNWTWPTNIPYIISSHYGWRWGTLHRGLDISGTGYGSPIYAAKPGVVTEVNYHYLSGNYVVINHQNGYYTRYAHMSRLSPYVKVGDYVTAGQTIGDMGSSGRSNGTHLHFELWYGKPYASGSQCYNPLLFY